jgi:hypothetical protein
MSIYDSGSYLDPLNTSSEYLLFYFPLISGFPNITLSISASFHTPGLNFVNLISKN